MSTIDVLKIKSEQFPSDTMTVADLKQILEIHGNDTDHVIFSTVGFEGCEPERSTESYFTGVSIHEKVGNQRRLLILHGQEV